MGSPLSLLKGLGLGAGLMYLFDPDLGRRRQALLRDQFVHMGNELEDFFQVATRDLSNRTGGLVAELGHLAGDEPASDQVLVDRVRSKLGRVVSHPRAIRVEARDGRVTLSGPILAAEVENLLSTVALVRGVAGVENRLEVHEQAGQVPALQGGVPRPGERSELFQETWSPATRLLVGVAGGVVALRLLGRGGVASLALGALGVGLIGRGLAQGSGGGGGQSGGGGAEGTRYLGGRYAERQPEWRGEYAVRPTVGAAGAPQPDANQSDPRPETFAPQTGP